MPDPTQTFYVTTPIYYVNARPHIGHAYTTIVADVLARRHRLLGHETFFLTGTDEHGQKIERSATAAGIPPQQFADQVSASFRALWHRMGITYTGSPAAPPLPGLPNFDRPEAGFIRTTDPRHKQGVQHLFTQLQQKGFIYEGTYTGQYCVSDEAYVEGPPGILCPDCGRLTETVSESNYYFRLSAFQLPLLNLIESDTLRIRPDSARNEVLSFLRGNMSPELSNDFMEINKNRIVWDFSDDESWASSELDGSTENPEKEGRTRSVDVSVAIREWGRARGRVLRTAAGTDYYPGALKDLSISRTSFAWGVPVPGDEQHVIYVWLDALANYMTALGYGSDDPAAQALFQKFWPADLHLVGKEIIRFHCIYWPAFLLALNPALTATPPNISALPDSQKLSSRPESLPSNDAAERPAFGPATELSGAVRNPQTLSSRPEQSEADRPAADLFATENNLSSRPKASQSEAAAERPAFGPATELSGAVPNQQTPSSRPKASQSEAAAERPAFVPTDELAGTPAPAQMLSSRPERSAVERPAVASATAASTSPLLSFRSAATESAPAPAQLNLDQDWAATMLPKSVVANGWLLFDNAKMSKSKGNVVRTETLLEGFGEEFLRGIQEHNARELKKDPAVQPVAEPTKHERDLFATDVLRYFLLREIPFGQDGSFSFDAMITRYNADLANGYGNLVSRTLVMVEQYGTFLAPDPAFMSALSAKFSTNEEVGQARAELEKQLNQFAARFSGQSFHELTTENDPETLTRNLEIVVTLLKHTDAVLSATAPWKSLRNAAAHGLVIDNAIDFAIALQSLQLILDHCTESIRILTALLYPILPFSTARVWAQLGLGSIEDAAANGDLRNLQWGGLQPGTKLGPLSPIFPRADKGLAQTMADIESTPPPSLLHVANDEHDAATTDHTAFREAPLASVAQGTTDQPAAAEAASEAHASQSSPNALSSRPERSEVERPAFPPAHSPGAPVPAEPTGSFLSTDPAAGPRTQPNPNPIAQVAGSFATTTATGPTLSHVDAEPSGIFATPASATPVSATPSDAIPQITIDDFAKIELRVAQILVAERIPKADKLLRLEVDLGYETRQILSGIAEWYTPESLIGRRIVVITNLAPRKMRGLDSHGMLLAASNPEGPAGNQAGGKPILATFAEDIALGSRLK